MPQLALGPAVQAAELGRCRAGVGEGPGGSLEQLGGAAVGQPGLAGDQARICGGHRAALRLARNTGRGESRTCWPR